jgi:activating signal cointegrator complex subunit 3
LGNATTSELYGLKRISFAERVVNTRMELPQMFNIQVTTLLCMKIYLFMIVLNARSIH